MLKRNPSTSKSPSTMKVRSKLSSHSQSNGLGLSYGDVPMPKTRFSLNDRSCSSPRLKSFPAEQIKRLEPQPVSNSQENAGICNPIRNTGQGDNPPQQNGFQSRPSSQFFPPPNQNMSSMSEQQVPRAICPIDEQVNQSELAIASPLGITATERPSHRPHVPRVNTTVRDQSPKKSFGPGVTRISQNADQTQTPGTCDGEPSRVRHRDPWSIENDGVKSLGPEKALADAGPADFRQASVPIDWNRNTNVPIRQTLIAGPNVSNPCPEARESPAVSFHPQQIDQGHQPNMANYHNNNVQRGEMVRRQIIEPHLGMTSPQDVAMNQREHWHRTMQHGSHSHNPWIQYNKAQTQHYPTNITPQNTNPAPSAYYRSMAQSEIPTVPNPHQIPQENGHTEQQCYHQQDHNASQARSAPPNNSKTPGIDNQHHKQNGKKKRLKFTPVMIKDQEMLVTTMRQQGIPEEIMRRQFDALLAEQRKQLLYLEQLEQSESTVSNTATQGRRVQRRISKIEEDGKPEWMLHITPPRIPYSVIEKMRSEREVELQQNSADVPQQYYEQSAQENDKRTCEHGGLNACQQPLTPSHDCGNSNVVNQQQTYSTTHPHGGQHQLGHSGYPLQQHLQQQNYPQQVSQEQWQDGVNNRGEKNSQDQRNPQVEKSLEPSSLLKLRQYREVIRQQKQNNGLQDPETIKEAMEALKNPANRKGLEYLDDLNKKSAKPFSLNGAQDPQEQSFTMNGSPQAVQCLRPSPKKPSANGLENQRNSNNPSSSSIVLRKKIEEARWLEYPRQKTTFTSRDCYSLIAENENGNPANSTSKKNHESVPETQRNFTMQNSTTVRPMHVQSRLENDGHVTGQELPNVVYSDGNHFAGANPSMLENQHRYHAGQVQEFYANSNNFGQANAISARARMDPQTVFPMEGPLHAGGGIPQQYSDGNNGIQEMIVSGGLKYLARKSKYIPNSSLSPSYQNSNPGNHYHPSVPCH